MASKDFTTKLKKNPQAVKVEPQKEDNPKQVEPDKEKKPVGRPKIKTEPTKTINIAVPVSVMEQVEIAKCKYHDNLTEYVNAVIKADLEKNMSNYQKLYELMNN